MNIPTITSIENALQIYYKYSEIGNNEINVLFGKLSSATLAKLKKVVKAEMDNQNKFSYGRNKINTKIAYNVWGIDITDLEERRNKLRSLDLQ